MSDRQFDRWYEREMRAPDGSYIKRIQDAPKEACEAVADVLAWRILFEREMFGTIYGIPIAEWRQRKGRR